MDNICELKTEPEVSIIQNEAILNEKVPDNSRARLGRISHFLELSSNDVIDLENAIGVQDVLNEGDNLLLPTLRCNIVEGKIDV